MVTSAVKESQQSNRTDRDGRLLRGGGMRGLSEEVIFELRLGSQMEMSLQRWWGDGVVPSRGNSKGKGLTEGMRKTKKWVRSELCELAAQR